MTLSPARVSATDLATLDAMEQDALDAIEAVRDPDEAEALLSRVKAVHEAQRLARLGAEYEKRWSSVRLRAERRYGELLGPAEHGGDRRSDQVTASDLKPADKMAASRARQVAEVPEDVFETFIEKAEEPTRAGLLREHKTKLRRDDVAAQRRTYKTAEGVDLRIGDFEDVLADVEDASVDLILTDPPYSLESVPLYGRLAEWGAAKLKPGGSLIAYCGQSTLPDVLDAVRPHLRYWWMLSIEHGQRQQLPGKFVMVEWKPAIWFVREKRGAPRLVADRLRHEKNPDQSEHRWAQDAGQLVPLIEQLTDPGDLVVDPFAGTGGFGLVATGMNRRWIGADLGVAVTA